MMQTALTGTSPVAPHLCLGRPSNSLHTPLCHPSTHVCPSPSGNAVPVRRCAADRGHGAARRPGDVGPQGPGRQGAVLLWRH
jgi:hypothetical protein